ncbi:MAG: Na+/H+ antiporter NhaC [Arenicellaceae bacterium]|nr:Na+/H+ antiporter NhaC [Arenicellaceae bacterium]
MFESASKPSVKHALVTFIFMLAWIAYTLFILHLQDGLHGVLMIALVWVICNSLWLGNRYANIRAAIMKGMARAMPALFIFLLIGVVIASFILSGTVATLVYYGLKFLDPINFLPVGLILCSLMSLATGTSWGTVGTAGIVLISVGGAMGMPLPLVAGMVVSGASFGDKMSPISDTTNLAAVAAGTDLYDHIKSMFVTTVPTYIITLLLFSWIGWGYRDQALPATEIQELMQAMAAEYRISILMLIPMVMLLILAARRVPAEAAMLIASLIALIFAILFQGASVNEVINSIYDGVNVQTENETLDVLLSRGGISDMAWTFTLTMIAIPLGSLLEQAGFLSVIVHALLANIKRRASLVSSAIISSFMSNIALAESYISIIINGQLFKNKFDETDIDRCVLSRSVEEGSTLMTALVPWTTTGVFYAATLGVPTLDYAQWALMNWINPLIGIFFAWLGIGLFRVKRTLAEGTS